MANRLWLLCRNETEREAVQSAVVRADSEQDARTLIGNANRPSVFDFFGKPILEGNDTFLDPEQTTCVELTTNGPAEVIATHFQYG